MEIENTFTKRLFSSFILFKDNFLNVFLGLYFISLISYLLQVAFLYVYDKFEVKLPENTFFDDKNLQFYQNAIYYIDHNLILLGVSFFSICIYLFFTMLLGVFLYKIITDLVKGNSILFKESFFYTISKYKEITIYYYYIFIYVAGLISGIIIVFGLSYLIFIYLGYLLLSAITFALGILVFLAILFFVVIKKSLKTMISIVGAVYEDDFSKENFSKILSYSDNKVLNVFGNLVGITVITYIIMTIVYIISLILGKNYTAELSSNGINIVKFIYITLTFFYSYIISIFMIKYYLKLKSDFINK